MRDYSKKPGKIPIALGPNSRGAEMLGRALAVAVLLTPIPFAGVAQAAAPIGPGFKISIDGQLHVHSYSFFGSNTHHYSFSHVFLVKQGNNRRENWSTSACAGNDTVGWVRFQMRYVPGNQPEVSTLIRLYTGDSCVRFENILAHEQEVPAKRLTAQPIQINGDTQSGLDWAKLRSTETSKFSLCCF
ncbi:hypothetical protein [Streptomyces sp. NRRL S-1022]|uniref:hypothetical protein n=1 Tax=Streptomyces sp. NRRL S-1022 TaxID=1463880 RepID=UPI00131E3D7C|nr:hypothetical protein [Streptomyces sp. NRRL S-1022]